MPRPRDSLSDIELRLDAILAELARLREQQSGDRQHFDGRFVRSYEMLQRVFDHEQNDRRAIRSLRAASDYDRPFSDPEPLVSVVIPTWNNVDGLVERSLPAVVAQTYQNFEVVVVGDASDPATGEALAALGDPRIRFSNLTVRGPYPDDQREAWLVSGTQPYNEAVHLSKGLWIAPMADDDAMHPDHIEVLLKHARAGHYEMAYGSLQQLRADGSETVLGAFPPAFGQIGLQGSIYHSGLKFMELELAHALFGTPNDWGLIRRMWLGGVRIGHLDRVVATYWPSVRAERAATEVAPKEVQQPSGRDVLRELEALRRDHARVVASRSWRMTAPLRWVRRELRRTL